MPATLIVQSHRSPLPFAWLERCLASVRGWSDMHGFAYRFIGDELFAGVPEPLLDKTRRQVVIATDLARLLVLKDALNSGYETVVWLDADVLVFDPGALVLPDEPCAVGREVWVQRDRHGKFKTCKKVHNAFLLFRRGNSLLDFYLDTAMRLLLQNEGNMPPQFIGPKLLTALHNVAVLPVVENIGMLSPLVIEAVLEGRGDALSLFKQHSPAALSAANLCSSSCERNEVSSDQMSRVIDRLLDDRQIA